MSVSVSYKPNIDKRIKTLQNRFPVEQSKAMRKVVFHMDRVVKQDFLSVVDGAPFVSKTGKKKYPKRTTRIGLRSDTSFLSQNIHTRFFRTGKLLGGSVGTNVKYGVAHERGGNRGRHGKYPFLKPALKASQKKLDRMYSEVFKRVARP